MTPAERNAHYRRLHQITGGREGMAVQLSDGVFWSKGWKGCEFCGRSAHHPVQLHRFRVVRNGRITEGWRCTPYQEAA
jgi:hypothetical protein